MSVDIQRLRELLAGHDDAMDAHDWRAISEYAAVRADEKTAEYVAAITKGNAMTIDIANLRRLLAAGTPGPLHVDYGTIVSGSGDLINADVEYDTPLVRVETANLELWCALVNAAPQLLAIAEAATAWGQTMCTKPRECTHGDHAGDCDLGAAEIRLLAAVDAARKERT